MKKLLLIVMMLTTVLFVGCGKEATQTTEEPVNQTEEIEIEEEIDESKLTEVRPVAVMIDNDNEAARPQVGLESAKMVYEFIIEGGSTRFMALFDNYEIEKVGPIRSSRHYFLDYVLEHDAIYCHAGWSPKAQNDIPKLKINNVNGILGDDGTAFYRDSTYDNTWHNLYSSLPKLTGMAEKKGYRFKTDKKHTAYSEAEYDLTGTACETVTIPYSNHYKVKYVYDAENKVYKRYINGREHVSQKDGVLTAKNIIVYQVHNYPLNDGENKDRQELENIGEGKGYFISNGQAVEINWSKKARAEKTVYTTADGKELLLNPGNTYIQIMPDKYSVTIE